MSFKKPITIYRSLIRDAAMLTWQRKSLWVFGIFAAFISTGGVLDIAKTGMHKVQSGGNIFAQLFEATFVGFTLFGQYIRQFSQMSPFWTTLLFLCTTLIFIGLVLLAVVSQASLIHGIKSPIILHPLHARKQASVHVSSIFWIDAFTKIISGILIVVSTLPVWWYYTSTSSVSFFAAFVQLVIFFPMILIINMLSMLSVIHVVETGESVSKSIADAWHIFSKHWLASIEFALVLFILMSGVGFLFLACAALVSIPFAVLYSVTLLSGSLFLFFGANLVFALVAFCLILMFGGSVVTFQYAAWYLFYKKTFEETHKKNPISKFARLFQKS